MLTCFVFIEDFLDKYSPLLPPSNCFIVIAKRYIQAIKGKLLFIAFKHVKMASKRGPCFSRCDELDELVMMSE